MSAGLVSTIGIITAVAAPLVLLAIFARLYAGAKAKAADERADRAEESERAKDEMRKAEARYRGGLGARIRRLLNPDG